MNIAFKDYFKIESEYGECLSLDTEEFPMGNGYFLLNGDILCFGRTRATFVADEPDQALRDIGEVTQVNELGIRLSFDPDEVVDNLRLERYAGAHSGSESSAGSRSLTTRIYYLLRPLMPVSVRKQLQRYSLRGWDRIPFPHWPVDCTVDLLMEELLKLVVRICGPVPIVWFWPDGLQSCVVMTHDVETQCGRDGCERLMDVDESFGIKSSFQIIPESRYKVDSEFLESIRSRGFEVNVHDYNHDGRLYSDRKTFEHRATKINEYARAFAARGFRSAVMYRELSWYDSFEFSYDMSVPNVAHMDPQRGGCCTVMPYFIGDILELPLTTTQDYPLFNILKSHSIDLWKKQVGIVRQRHGMASFNVHPDYLGNSEAEECYRSLLGYLVGYRDCGDTWFALPGEVDDWWRTRNQLRLVLREGTWEIEGQDSDRATVAYAKLIDGKLIYCDSQHSIIDIREMDKH